MQVRRLLDHADGAFRGLCETVIVTGARPGELANARVRDFSRTDGTLSLTGKTGHRTSYLSQQGFEMFTQLSRGKLPGALLLPNDAGMPWRKEHWRDLMMRARKTAHLPADTVMYSLRHYAVSKMLVAGVAPQVTAENTGTSIRMIERHYGKFTALDRRTMLDRVEVAL
ncbi:MAG: tyrosine-type recombinase/integrase [Pseudomonadota bacterium]|nr:tyrosine-type recombinase/integrase [Pseudomonadota bacterium]